MKVCPCCKTAKEDTEFLTRKIGYRAGQLRPECRVCEKQRMADYWARHPEKRSEQRKAWRNRDRAKNGSLSPGEKRRRENSPSWRLQNRLRNRVRNVVARARGHKSARTQELVGCSWDHLRLWLVFNFQPGMSLKNYGLWHVDHILPCSSFDLTDPAQQRACFHYTNLQPLWAKDNLAKSDKLPEPESPCEITPFDTAFNALVEERRKRHNIV
jgi:hypothetical protein